MALKRTKVFGYTKRMARDPRVSKLRGRELGMFIFLDRLHRAGKLDTVLPEQEVNLEEGDENEKTDTE